jgi:phospholipid-binding lipoprotein MlaA
MRVPRLRGAFVVALGLLLAAPSNAEPGAEVSDAGAPVGIETIPEADPLDPRFDEPDPLFDESFDDEMDDHGGTAASDPFEGTNRNIFVFNQAVENWVFDPLTRGYRFIMPPPLRKGIRRAVHNLNSPKVFVNDLLQLRFCDAGETLGRFLLNSTLGIGGLLDPALEAGWEPHEADFGQTLGKMGVGSGPYLVIPVFGPTTVRDGFGVVVDMFFQPLTYIFGPADLLLQLYISGGTGIVAIEESYDKLQALEDSSIDYYAALRSAYLQNREAEIWGTRNGEGEPVALTQTP